MLAEDDADLAGASPTIWSPAFVPRHAAIGGHDDEDVGPEVVLFVLGKFLASARGDALEIDFVGGHLGGVWCGWVDAEPSLQGLAIGEHESDAVEMVEDDRHKGLPIDDFRLAIENQTTGGYRPAADEPERDSVRLVLHAAVVIGSVTGAGDLLDVASD